MFPYNAIVTETGLGSTGRAIRVANEIISARAGLVYPLLDGMLKLPPPEVDEVVTVFTLDKSNLYRFYLPIRTALANDDSGVIQVGDASEFTVLGETLLDLLGQLCDALAIETHTGNIGLPTSPPLNAATYSSLKTQIAAAKSAKVKIE
jgi:hypothetical protein